MTRVLDFPITVIRDPHTIWIGAPIPGSQVQTWCLELALLLADLNDSLILRSADITVSLSVDKDLDPHSRGFARHGEKTVSFGLTPIELEAWMRFFLVAYRDDQAPSSILEMDLDPPRTNIELGTTLSFDVEKAKASLTKEEYLEKVVADDEG